MHKVCKASAQSVHAPYTFFLRSAWMSFKTVAYKFFLKFFDLNQFYRLFFVPLAQRKEKIENAKADEASNRADI